jgi:PAS domain S-box-containing protein
MVFGIHSGQAIRWADRPLYPTRLQLELKLQFPLAFDQVSNSYESMNGIQTPDENQAGQVHNAVFDRRGWLEITLSSIGDGVITTDSEGRVNYLNPVAEKLTGWTIVDAVGKKIELVFHIVNETTGQPVEQPVRNVIQRGVAVGLGNHTLLIARDGSQRPIDDSAVAIRDDDGQVVGVVLIFRDITERRQSERLVASGKEYAESIVKTVREPLVVLDSQLRVQSANPSFYQTFQFAPAETEGHFIYDLGDRQWNIPALKHLLEEIVPLNSSFEDWLVEHDFEHIGRKTMMLSARRFPPEGKYDLILLAIEDITARKLAEGEREKVVAQLREQDKQKDEFLAMLAHELRNPLAAISNAVALMALTDAKEQRDYAIEAIQRQSRHLSRIIEDLLDISRINHGKLELRREIVDAGPILESAAQAVETLVKVRNHTLDVAIDRGNVWVDADPTRLEQIVVNLLNNAAKYSENGGHIELSGSHEGDDIVIRVKDAGIGIPPDKLPEMFQLFTQGDRSSARSEGGLGIGLTMVKKLVEMHGGSVTACSEGLGKGTEFVVRLPAAKHAAVTPTTKRPPPAGRKIRILVVDDNVDTAKGMAILLQLTGYDVVTAYSGPEAIEAAQAQRPELILLDIGLPGMDGYEVAKRLRQHPCCEDCVIVAASGYGQEDDYHRSSAAGFDYHLVKPIDFNALSLLLGKATMI